jgi:NADH-quinone oxidoreductase subunit E
MLTEPERSEIDEVLAHVPQPASATIDALRIVQRRRGWVSDEAVSDIAAHLGISVTELDSIATFYNRIHRKPVGRHVIYVCDSMSCWLMGCEALFAELNRQLAANVGETSADGRFTVLPIQCLGACDRAPTLLIGDELHARVDPARIAAILSAHR